MKIVNPFLFAFLLVTGGCAKQHANQNPAEQVFPVVTGQSLENRQHCIPACFAARSVLLLVGYKQAAQFDIDRRLIGLDTTGTQVDVYELPAIQGILPRMFENRIDDGMRAGIPKELWKGVITIYADGGVVQTFTGNEHPDNARCILLDA